MPSSLLSDAEPFAALAASCQLDARLARGAARLGFAFPTLVQAKALPLGLSGRDLLVRARTGSGKTAAYGLVALQKIVAAKASANVRARGGGVRALVLVPTRELVDQTAAALAELAFYCADLVSVFALGGAAAGGAALPGGGRWRLPRSGRSE